MEKQKLTIEDLAPYLPYSIKCLSGDSKEIYELSGLTIRYGWVNYERRIEIYGENSPRYYTQELKNCKPLLYPLSHLTKEIEVEGKMFIPIVELAKIEDVSFNKVISIYRNDDECVLSKFVSISYVDDDNNNLILKFDFTNKSFHLRIGINKIEMLHPFELYKMMYKWNLDINDLISQGLAIDKTKIKD